VVSAQPMPTSGGDTFSSSHPRPLSPTVARRHSVHAVPAARLLGGEQVREFAATGQMQNS
jgi:hypothetical protein